MTAMSAEPLQALLERAFPEATELSVVDRTGGGDHFQVTVVSGWPTIPQIFIKGELVGGADIVEELAASGELETKLREKLGEGYRETAETRVVDVLQPA